MKKFLSVILALVMLLAGATMVSADDGSGKKDVGEHEHILMDMSNAACHYSECTICFELFNVGDHTFVDGKCSVCGHASVYGNPTDEDIRGEGEHEHILMNGADIASHYEECQVCFVLFNVEDHTFVDGKCSVCGYRELINPFVDVPEDAWYHDEVVEAVATGIINGKTPTEFMPDDFLTYAEAVKLAACMNQVYLYGKVTLTAGEPWYKPYADYCRENGITTKDYDYNAKATRAGYMEIFANALPDEAFSDINAIVDGSILDVDGSAPYAIYVYKMYRAGIVTGVDEMHNCNPDANIKRCEVATIISRMMNEENRVRFNMGTDDETIGVIPDPEEEAQQPGTDNQKAESWDDPTNIPPENPEVANKVPVQEVTPDITVVPTVPGEDIEKILFENEDYSEDEDAEEEIEEIEEIEEEMEEFEETEDDEAEEAEEEISESEPSVPDFLLELSRDLSEAENIVDEVTEPEIEPEIEAEPKIEEAPIIPEAVKPTDTEPKQISILEETAEPVRYYDTPIADRAADIRAEIETKIRLEYESRARMKAEAELVALRREQERLRMEKEALEAEAKKEQERLIREYELLRLKTQRAEEE